MAHVQGGRVSIDAATLAAAVEASRADFATRVIVEEPDPQPSSHRSFAITGMESPAAVQSIGCYLVALVIQAVTEDLQILGEAVPPDAHAWGEVESNLGELIGASNEVDEDFRVTRRDPWIMEALTRLMVHTADVQTNGFPSDILAATRVTPSVTRSGMDLVAISRAPADLDCLVGEVKATEDNLTGNLSNCYSTFKEVATGDRSLELRTHLQNLALPLPAAERERVSKMMYSARPILMPIVSHGPLVAFAPGRSREKLRARLLSPPERFRFIMCPLEDYRAFFDGVAEAMRGQPAAWRA